MKLTIISDIHFGKSRDDKTLFYAGLPEKPINQNPLSSILSLISEEEKIESEVLICLGDLCNRAYNDGIIIAWDSIEKIHKELGTSLRIGIPGNHDIDSRKIHGIDPFNFIKNFSNDFPTNDQTLNSLFWDEGFCLLESDSYEILMINSVKDHVDEESAKYSILETETLENIDSYLKKKSKDRIKICVLHHHPIKHSNIENWKDSDSMERGDQLISILNGYNFDVMIHGHKHQPRVVDINGLTILASGSFSSIENIEFTTFKTMFHLIDIEKKGKGRISSWEFNINNGWKQNLNNTFPPEIGFGEASNPNELAEKINELFKKNNERPLLYADVLAQIPNLDYMIPERLIRLGSILNSKYNLFPQPEFPLTPQLITLKR
ncbi:metallophosphoesterase [uncultured Tenacibaculum sp.]|uniref:metallophosphoesterase family protein n=1 Tax=uncultured Tenacibaculum sp. TaxID=174713 RepID=UPI00262509D4|nr:metallophosphoesterase [uncultured Tenacibaculum sp.]